MKEYISTMQYSNSSCVKAYSDANVNATYSLSRYTHSCIYRLTHISELTHGGEKVLLKHRYRNNMIQTSVITINVEPCFSLQSHTFVTQYHVGNSSNIIWTGRGTNRVRFNIGLKAAIHNTYQLSTILAHMNCIYDCQSISCATYNFFGVLH